jgi:hypothetical protein
MTYLAKVIWLYEDRLDDLPRPPTREEYMAAFESSRVIDGVRMFPAVVVRDETFLITGLAT